MLAISELTCWKADWASGVQEHLFFIESKGLSMQKIGREIFVVAGRHLRRILVVYGCEVVVGLRGLGSLRVDAFLGNVVT